MFCLVFFGRMLLLPSFAFLSSIHFLLSKTKIQKGTFIMYIGCILCNYIYMDMYAIPSTFGMSVFENLNKIVCAFYLHLEYEKFKFRYN